MRVVFLSASAELGGAERSLLDLLAAVRAAEPEWTLRVIAPAAGPLHDRARSLGVETVMVPFPSTLARLGDAADPEGGSGALARLTALPALARASLGVARYVARLRRELAAWRPDLIHANGLKMHVLGLWARPARVPIVWHVHDYLSSRPVMSALLRYHASRCAVVVANSDSVARDVRAVCGDAVEVVRVYNGVDLEEFAPAGPTLDLDALSGLPRPNGPVVRVGIISTAARWKGQELFLRALSLLDEDTPVRGYVIGGGIYVTSSGQYDVEELRRLADELGVGARVGFTGLVPAPAAAMRALDVIVHASTRPEPFGLVIIEGAACGRPVIVSGAGGAAELLRAEVEALVFPPGDAAALAACIGRLAADAALRAELAGRARAAAEQRFDRRRLAEHLVPLYRRLVPPAR